MIRCTRPPEDAWSVWSAPCPCVPPVRSTAVSADRPCVGRGADHTTKCCSGSQAPPPLVQACPGSFEGERGTMEGNAASGLHSSEHWDSVEGRDRGGTDVVDDDPTVLARVWPDVVHELSHGGPDAVAPMVTNAQKAWLALVRPLSVTQGFALLSVPSALAQESHRTRPARADSERASATAGISRRRPRRERGPGHRAGSRRGWHPGRGRAGDDCVQWWRRSRADARPHTPPPPSTDERQRSRRTDRLRTPSPRRTDVPRRRR